MDIGQLRQFFNELGPRLEMAREVDGRLNRQLALRFNVLNYIRTSELGLSKVIADLLNPRATHDQGVLFLEVLLGLLRDSSERGGRPLRITEDLRNEWQIDPRTVVVLRERSIATVASNFSGRLDVSVEFINVAGEKQCLAIENKPYAGDGDGQVEKYLDFLNKEYPENHSLLYVSPRGELPHDKSLCPKRRQKARDRGQFAVMAYSGRELVTDGVSNDEPDPRLDHSLADWFRKCRTASDVDRLRVFLQDAAQFCDRHFGGAPMPDMTQEQIRQFLAEPKNLEVFAEVSRHWPEVRTEIVTQFADRLAKRLSVHLRESLPQLGDLQCEHAVRVYGRYWTPVRVFRGDWHKPHVDIRMEASPGLENWVIGVNTGPTEFRKALKTALEADLGKQRSSRDWPWYKNFEFPWPKHDWNDLVPVLAQETATDGDAIRYFLKQVGEVCEAVVPIIDKQVRRDRAAVVGRRSETAEDQSG